MNTVAFAFLTALCSSVVLTPLIRRLGIRLGVMDKPDHRKVHNRPIPRIGGIALVLAFLSSLVISALLFQRSSLSFPWDQKMTMLLVGGLVVFAIGLLDDVHRLPPGIKFLCQVAAASIAFWGGVRIDFLLDYPVGLAHVSLSYLITVFWFVLFINALNLIDGLDGLATGISFFTCLVMTLLTVWRGDFSTALLFGALAGASLGFLRYNFNPASIFMGDGGSYFLGYAIAGISIVSSSKSQVGATILIPLVALGIPIFDTILSPIRRFLLGKAMFRPDTGHVHHKLVAMGLSTRYAVLTIYFLSALLCAVALIMVNLHNLGMGIFLVSLGLVAFLFMKKLGYLEHIAPDKVYRWFKDVSDEAGLTHDRRSFLNLQIDINNSRDLEEFWQKTCLALTMLDFDMSRAHFAPPGNGVGGLLEASEASCTTGAPGQDQPGGREALTGNGTGPPEWVWVQNGFDPEKDHCKECLLKLELPLLNERNAVYGTLWLFKDLKRTGFSHYTLRRVEHLRRTMTRTLEKLSGSKQ